MKKHLFFVFTLMFMAIAAVAQPPRTYSVNDKKAVKKYEEALKLYDARNNPGALSALEELVQDTPEFIEAYYLIAQLHDEMGHTEKAIEPLTKALAIDDDFFPMGWMMLAESHYAIGQYKEAEAAISNYMPYPKNDLQIEKRCQLILSGCIYAQKAMANPVPFEPKNMGPGVNTSSDEYYPCITADEQTLLFTRLIDDRNAYNGKQEDFFIAQKDKSTWLNAAAVVSVNTPMNEGAPTLSADGQIMVFTACETTDGMWGGNRQGIGSCDLFYAYRTSNGWTDPKNLGSAVNSGAWESQPSYSADGRTLYFIRGKRSARGIVEQDIYFSYLGSDGRWSPAQKVPGKVNTTFEEESVMIHPDGRTLYFSSNGHPGMGGLDIFVSRMLPDGTWDTPKNLGYPINTYADENSLHVSANGQLALFASRRDGGYGGLDLYEFDLYEGGRPDPVTYVTGTITDKLSFKKLEAHLELYDLETGKLMVESYSNPYNGQYLFCIPSGKDYALNVNKELYLFHSENFSLKNYKSLQPYQLDIQLQKLRMDGTIVLRNVFFASNSATLEPQSKVELNKLVDLLNANPTKNIEISGHTDNVGNDAANLSLSEQRSRAVVDYLISKGIATERLTAKGYGETKPITSNETEEGRAQNRRTEFKILN